MMQRASRFLRVLLITYAAQRSQWIVMFAVCLGATLSANAADPLKIGGKLPAFVELPSVQDRTWSDADFSDATVLIVAFTCNRCPYAVDYEDGLIQLHAFCKDSQKSVELLVINSNAGRDESLEKMRQRAQQMEFPFRYVKDTDQSVARAFGAVYTPEFFVFDQHKTLAYQGALDDATGGTPAKVNHVHQAVQDLLDGREVALAEVGARGCTIRFKRQRPRPGRQKSAQP